MKKNISVLGSTGSIGTQTLDVASHLGIKVCAISGNRNITLLENQIRKFKPEIVAVKEEKYANELKIKISDTQTKIKCGEEGICEVATNPNSDTVVTAISGIAGLKPTVEAIKSKKTIALANKETLVTGGELVKKLAKEHDVKILPVDSEHSAIFQCLEGCKNKENLKKLILTASGGPFFGKTFDDLKNVTVNEALNHPSWSMGAKISIDSATMMNKGLEIIEAVHLFDMLEEKIDVIIHPQSIIHSMVEYKDGSVISQLGTPDMRTPIQYALTYPNRRTSNVEPLNLSKIRNLSFFSPDENTFEAIKLCRNAVKIGGNAPIILNCANEEAVALFLENKIKFLDIISIVKRSLEFFPFRAIKTFDDIYNTDTQVRKYIKNNFENMIK